VAEVVGVGLLNLLPAGGAIVAHASHPAQMPVGLPSRLRVLRVCQYCATCSGPRFSMESFSSSRSARKSRKGTAMPQEVCTKSTSTTRICRAPGRDGNRGSSSAHSASRGW
jgi:hypothetical protein